MRRFSGASVMCPVFTDIGGKYRDKDGRHLPMLRFSYSSRKKISTFLMSFSSFYLTLRLHVDLLFSVFFV